MIAQREQEREQLGQAILKEFEGVWAEVVAAEDGSAAEELVVGWVRGVGRKVLEGALQAAIEAKEEQPVICCEHPMRAHSKERREALTLLGPVRVRRRYLLCPRCGKRGRPADGWLRWRGGFSFALEEIVAWECGALPYREALKSLAKLAGVELSLHAAEDIVARWGEASLAPAPYADPVPGRLVAQLDGTTTHLEDGWREIKVGACFSWEGVSGEARPQGISYVADWESAQQFADTLWREALARGAPTAKAQAVLGDGAPWVWELASLLFPRATQILDWYHLTEHLWTAAKVVHGEGSEETKSLEKWWEGEVWEGRSELVEQHLRELVSTGKDDRDNTLRRCADYLQTHQARLRYHLFRAAGWPVGSGVVEGACKHLIGLRFKRQSTRWTKVGAQAVLHLRLDRLNDRWNTRCQFLRKTP
jgi:hypothetical protein